ncbi:hypothetical protein ACSFA8_26690 [Variovorax sp. RT4R15]|uniref:hypothetical protein n=1 Tax=Variovorax sp. RT4R15 TaxID=3443737 RepID=UPI003F4880FB
MRIRTSYPGQAEAIVEAPTYMFEQWFEGEVDGKPFQPPFIKFLPSDDEITELKNGKLYKLISESSEKPVVEYNKARP